MKKILKVMSLTMLGTIGILALVIGGMFLFGGFDEKPVYAQDLTFNSSEIISSTPIILQVNTSTAEVNKKDLVLYTSPGGEHVIEFPERITLGQPFSVTPKFSEDTRVNNGGYVELFAKYDGSQSNQAVVASCKILIDVPATNIAIKKNEKIIKLGTPYSFAKNGDRLIDIINISPQNALIPYVDKSILLGNGAGSVFNFSDKKIFLKLFNADKNIHVDAFFRSDGVYSKTIEVKYDINNRNDIIFTSDIDIIADSLLGDIYIKPYIIPTYENQKLLTPDNANFLDYAIEGDKFNLSVINYSVDAITVDDADKFIYYNEPIQMFINNPNIEAGGLNLNIKLKNNSNLEISPSLYKNNIYLSVDNKDIMSSLTKSDPSIAFEEKQFGINVDYTGIPDEMEKWNWKYFYQDFLCYYNYKQNSIDSNKIKINVTYYDGVNKPIKTFFYLTPRIREVTGIVPKYESGQTEFTLNSGDEFTLSEKNFEFQHKDQEVPTFPYLQFYIPFNSSNIISTVPVKQNNYYITTNILIEQESSIRNFKLFGEWASFVLGSKIIFTQGENSYTWTLDPSGQPQGDTILLSGNKTLKIEAKIKLNTRVDANANIFQIQTDKDILSIKASQTRFYELNESGEISEKNPLPYLSINNVVYTSNFDFYTDEKGNKYIHLLSDVNTVPRVSGIGNFQIIAQSAYISKDSKVYWLDSSIYVNVQVYEFLQSLTVYDWDNENSKAVKLPTGVDNYIFEEEHDGIAMTKYLYLTSDEKDALKRTFEEGLLNVKFEQDFQSDNVNPDEYVSELSKSLSQINNNPIEFSPLTPIYDKFDTTVVLGYKFSYTIRKIFTIELENGKRLNNKFNIFVTANSLTTKGQKAIFVKDGLEEENIDKLPIQIKDRTLNHVELSYEDSSGTKENPLKLTAKISKDGSSKLVWLVNESQTEIEELTGLTYGFKYSDKDEAVDVSRLRFNLTTNGVLFNESDFFRFTPNIEGKGGLKFNNVPYVEEGIPFVMTIRAIDKFDDNIFYRWNKEQAIFEEVINKSLTDGKKLYISVKGLQIDIGINEKVIVGNKTGDGQAISLFGGEKPLFTIKGTSGIDSSNVNYSNLFKMKVISSTQVDDFKVDAQYKNIEILKDFIVDETMDFQFYYGTESNLLKIHKGESLVQRHIQTIKGAYTFNIKNVFTAPTKEPQSFVESITYGGEVVLDDKIDYKVTLQDCPYPEIISIKDNKLTIKSMTNPFKISLLLTLKRYNDDLTIDESSIRQKIYSDIEIVSLYKDEDVIFGVQDGENYTLTAGHENSIKLNKNFTFKKVNKEDKLEDCELELAYKNHQISGIQFEITDLEPTKSPKISEHMKILNNGSTNVELYSYDLNLDKKIEVKITFLFADNGGSFSVNKQLTVLKNFDIQLDPTLLNKKSGDIINLGTVQDTYVVTRNNKVLPTENEYLQETDFTQGGKYSADSFSGYEEYFTANTGVSDSVFDLQVKFISEMQGQKVPATFTFRYETNQHYYLYFTFTIMLTIKNI